MAQLTQAGTDKVFKEVASGSQDRHAQLHWCLKLLEEGDVLLVTRLDRRARSTSDLLKTLALVAEKKARFRYPGIRGPRPRLRTAP